MGAPKKKAFVNPFDKGVTYEQFLKSLPKGKSISDHLKGKCSDIQIAACCVFIMAAVKSLRFR